MRKYYQYFGLALIMVFSFYYTEKIALIVLNKNPLMQSIQSEKENYEVDYVNAFIDGDYIIPGVNGLVVNTRESFYQMQKLDVFNVYYLVYEQISPEVSLKDNKDKIIRQGNPKLNKVSIILSGKSSISDYLESKNIKADLLVNLDNYQENSYFEVVNDEKGAYSSLENTLRLNKEGSNICVIHNMTYEECLETKNYIVEPTLVLDEYNYIDVKNKLNKGSIILALDTARLSDVKLLLKELQYKNLDIVYLSEIISEENGII